MSAINKNKISKIYKYFNKNYTRGILNHECCIELSKKLKALNKSELCFLLTSYTFDEEGYDIMCNRDKKYYFQLTINTCLDY